MKLRSNIERKLTTQKEGANLAKIPIPVKGFYFVLNFTGIIFG